MRSPQDMQIVLIDITNACTERCSNCTRFCGNHKKPFFMDFETFKRAVDSMEGFPGLVALIGGEPTLHPEFERFCEYLQTRYPRQERQKRLYYPQKQFIVELLHQEFESHRIAQKPDGRRTFERAGIGIYSNTSGNYHRFHELIQDTFQVQFLNDHINPSFHQPGLFARKDLGISDAEWIPIRDNCWLQNAWSATITPKGAFFCEVAAAMDMLFDGPGGWPIEPGWWKRQPSDFGDQKRWCEFCGFPLQTFMRPSSDEIDDVSPTMYEKLKEIGSPRLKAGRTHLVDIKDGVIDDRDKASGKRFFATQKYVEHYEDRFNAQKSLLFVDEFDVAKIPDGDAFGQELNAFMKSSKDWIVFVANEGGATGVPKVLVEPKTNDEIHTCLSDEADLASDSIAKKVTDFVSDMMRSSVMNPGTMHIGDGFYLFNKNALSLKKLGFDRISGLKSFKELVDLWTPEKVIRLSDTDKVLEWHRDSIVKGKRYAIWGMGLSGSFLADTVMTSGGILELAVDKDEEKQNTDFYGARVHAPSYLVDHLDEFDYLMVAHYSRFDEIYKEAVALGVPEDKIIMPYEI